MYENMTYEVILKRMLDRVPTELDKREGSLIYTALTAAAAEMQIMYIEFDTILKETFADTASRDNLIRRAAERGMNPFEATKAVLKAVATPDTIEISLGERFRLGMYTYVITGIMGNGEYQVTCELAGTCGNHQLGRLTPITNVPGLSTMELTELLIPGEDDEDTETFRKAYFQSFQEKAFSGNRTDYINKTNSIAGVGATKVTRAWNGESTVKLTILDSKYQKASDVLIHKVQETIDPNLSGNGDGLAPIDHVVTVDTAEEVKILVKSQMEFDSGYTYDSLKEKIKDSIEAYLGELRTTWEELGNQGCMVRISQIESRILGIKGITDISGTQINEAGENLKLSKYQIPIYGGVEVETRS